MRWAHRAAAAQATMLPEEQLQPHNHSTVTFSQELLYPQPSSGRRERACLQQIQAMLFLMLQPLPLLRARHSTTTVLAGVAAYP